MSSKDSHSRFTISMVGPSRIGKTTLITALLEAGQDCFAGTNISLKVPHGTTTEKRVSLNRRELDAHIRSRSFDPGGIRGTSELFVYELLLDPRVPGYETEINVVDFPGGWLDPTRRPDGVNWQKVLEYIKASSVLAVPIDATVLMEANHNTHRGSWPHLLLTGEVREVVREWAKCRAEFENHTRKVFLESVADYVLEYARQHLSQNKWAELHRKLIAELPSIENDLKRTMGVPAILVLAPLKCESYFPDAAAPKDEPRSGVCNLWRTTRLRETPKELRRRVDDLYGDIMETARSEYKKAEVLYCAIDSIGCVELESSKWEKQDDGYYLHCRYRVRPPYKRVPRMADILIRLIAYNFVKWQTERSKALQLYYSRLQDLTTSLRPTGGLSWLWAWVTGDLSKIDTLKKTTEVLSETEQGYLQTLFQRLNELGDIDRYMDDNPTRCCFLSR